MTSTVEFNTVEIYKTANGTSFEIKACNRLSNGGDSYTLPFSIYPRNSDIKPYDIQIGIVRTALGYIFGSELNKDKIYKLLTELGLRKIKYFLEQGNTIEGFLFRSANLRIIYKDSYEQSSHLEKTYKETINMLDHEIKEIRESRSN